MLINSQLKMNNIHGGKRSMYKPVFKLGIILNE